MAARLGGIQEVQGYVCCNAGGTPGQLYLGTVHERRYGSRSNPQPQHGYSPGQYQPGDGTG